MTLIQKIKIPLAFPHYAISSLMLIASMSMFVVGLALKYEFLMFEIYFNSYYGTIIWFLIAASIVIIADAFWGIISMAQRWYKGIIMFLIFTVIIFITTIILVALTCVFSITAEKTIYSRLKNDMIKNYTVNSDAIDNIQNKLNCCGYENFYDWKNQSNVIPQSCCSFQIFCDTEIPSEIRSTGCRDALESFLKFRKMIIAIVLGALGTVEIVSIVLSFVVCRDLAQKIMQLSTPITVHIEGSESTSMQRIHNPLGQTALSTIGNERPHEPYVRRPSQFSVKLFYRNPHESFLRQQPQRRFDIRHKI